MLLSQLFFPGLCLHLLHLDGVGLASSHVQLVVAHTQGQDTFVDAQAGGVEHKVGGLLVDGLDDKLLVVEGNVADFTPREADLWC